MNKVTIIIPNYNGLKFMNMCMSALKKQSFRDFSLLIVDNGSTDGSVEYIKELSVEGLCFDAAEGDMAKTECDMAKTADSRAKADGNIAKTADSRAFARVDHILLKDNTGFSGAVNAGITAADSEYIILLNNDTEPDTDYVGELVAFMDNHRQQNCFAASPKMIQLYHGELLDDAGDGYNLLGWGFQRGVGQSVEHPKFCKTARVFSACAGAAIYSKAALEAVSFGTGMSFELLENDSDGNKNIEVKEYFDQQHFAYLEDIDISYRANRAGFNIYYCPSAKVLHVGSGTSGSKYNNFKVKLAARNNIFLVWKNMPLLQLFLNLPFIALGTFVKYLFFVKNGFGSAYTEGLREGLENLSKCKKKPAGLAELPRFIYIEYLLIRDSFDYVGDFLSRKLFK